MKLRFLMTVSLAAAAAEFPDWQTAILSAAEPTAKGRFDEAEERLLAAMKLAGDDAEQARTWNNLGSVYQGQGRYAEAKKAYHRSVALWERVEGVGGPRKAYALHNLAGLLADLRRPAEAERHVRRTLEIHRNWPDEPGPGMDSILNNLGILQIARKRYVDAERTFLEALAENAREPGVRRRERISFLHNLAMVRLRLGRVQEAVQGFEESIVLGESIYGPDSARLGWLHLGLAQAYSVAGRELDTARRLEIAKSIAESRFPATHPLRVQVLAEYARLLRRQHRGREAKQAEREAASLLKAHAAANQLQHTVDFESLRARR